MLTSKAFLNKYRRAYEDLDTKENKFVLYPIFFYYRRILVPMSVIFWPN